MNNDKPDSMNEARAKILAAANALAKQRKRTTDPLSMRHINRAVCIARHNNLVPADVLTAAGFRAEARR